MVKYEENMKKKLMKYFVKNLVLIIFILNMCTMSKEVKMIKVQDLEQ